MTFFLEGRRGDRTEERVAGGEQGVAGVEICEKRGDDGRGSNEDHRARARWLRCVRGARFRGRVVEVKGSRRF